MPTPKGWEWLSELPEEWQPPPELQSPTNSAEANLAIKILSCGILGHEVVSALGRYITENARFTIWFLRDVKGSDRGMKELALLVEVPSEQTRIVYEAWKRFEAVDAMKAPDEVLRARRVTTQAALAVALRRAAETLASVREGSANEN